MTLPPLVFPAWADFSTQEVSKAKEHIHCRHLSVIMPATATRDCTCLSHLGCRDRDTALSGELEGTNELKQVILAEGEGSVRLTSSLRLLVL